MEQVGQIVPMGEIGKACTNESGFLKARDQQRKGNKSYIIYIYIYTETGA